MMANLDDLMRDCLKAIQEGKKDEAADFFTEDGIWATPFGKFIVNQIGKKFVVK